MIVSCKFLNVTKHNFRSWLNSRQREIEMRKWGHTDTARLIVCDAAPARSVVTCMQATSLFRLHTLLNKLRNNVVLKTNHKVNER